MSFVGKTAVVTGSNSGIGLGVARELARAGANVVLNSFTDRAEDHALAKSLASEFGVTVRYIAADMSKGADCRRLIADAGTCDILVNNAGIASRGVVLEHTDEQWDQTIEIDLNAPFLLSREFARGMAARGSGKIIFTASMWTFLGGKNVISYTAAKTALGGLTRGLSNELSPMGINVNAIAPGFIETDINSALRQDKARFEFLSSRIPMGRWGKPSDLAGTTLFLASAASDYVTGVVLPVDGGYLAN